MRPRATGVPLAFALALSASTSDAATLTSTGQTELLAPGSLKSLLNAEQETAGQLPRSIGRLGQWFNGGWFNCFTGGWRRC